MIWSEVMVLFSRRLAISWALSVRRSKEVGINTGEWLSRFSQIAKATSTTHKNQIVLVTILVRAATIEEEADW